MSSVLALHPKARWVLAAYHFGSCASCRISADETLEQAAAAYGIMLERLLADLNSLLDVSVGE